MRDDWVECELEIGCKILDNLRKPINSRERNNRISGISKEKLFPYYGATGQVGYIDEYLTDGEFILIGEDAAPFLDHSKDVAYKISGKTWVNNHAHILKSKFNNDFLLYYLNCFNYKNYVSGTTRLKLTQGKLKQIPLKLASLPEQRAIVAKIETLFSDLDKGIADLKTAQEQLKIYRQAVLKKAFDGEFKKVELGDVCERAIKIKRKEMALNKPLLYLDIGGIDNKANKIISHKEYTWQDAPSRAQQIVQVGDILFSTVRTYLKNIAQVLNPIYDGEIASSGFTVIRGKKDLLNPKYIFFITIYQGFLEPLSKLQRGTSYPAVRNNDIFSQIIPLPSLKEQHQIIKEIETRLSVCNKLEQTITESLEKSNSFRQSILKKAFEGKLLNKTELEKCKQDKDYEPASELLKKIKATQ
ncbi:restriction endonuclease subunit S [Candidatus Halobeggiatoa sp. HSG11]|nr:restriction endonuclease subunit S [Candidatus Halobeggiatoa sp. HSG11]